MMGLSFVLNFDVKLMWPDKKENLNKLIKKVKNKAKKYGRSIKFGLRIHVIVRETEDEAKAYARGLISKLDLKKGEDIKPSLRFKIIGCFNSKQFKITI